MDEVITLVYWASYCFFHPFTLQPWLSILIIDVIVSSEKWIPSTELIELNEKFISWISIEPWYIRTTEGMSTYTKLKQHGDWSLNFIVCGQIVASPKSAKLLTP
jgi:hypothetical protein